MDLQNPNYLADGIPTIVPMFNNEEKLDELQRLLEILAKRKKYSIIVSMLVVFQQYNFQKLLKDFLTDGVREIIIKNPLKVVSYHGVPFTVHNFFRGMRVEYSKHKLFQREIIEGNEYVYVNLVYTCIFLSDEIAKICKGSRNLKLKTIHASLIDEIDMKSSHQTKEDNYNTSSKFINEMKNLEDGDNKLQENIQKEINNDTMGKRLTRRQKNNFMNGAGGVISLEESDEENEEGTQNESNNNKKEEKINKIEKQKEQNMNNINNSKNESNNTEGNINSVISKEKENTKKY